MEATNTYFSKTQIGWGKGIYLKVFLAITIISESNDHLHNSKPQGVRVGKVGMNSILS